MASTASIGLRASLIWDGEVMADVVTAEPVPITVGATRGATFVVPDLGLPPGFAIVRPGRRGHVVVLGEQMRGTIRIDGVERDIAELVRADGDGGFCAVAIGGLDAGVVDLDGTGRYQLVFQRVELDEPLARPRWQSDPEARASLAFSIVLHAALLVATFRLYTSEEPFVWPGPRALTGDYLITRIAETRLDAAAAGAGAAAPSPTIDRVNREPAPLAPPPNERRLRPPGPPARGVLPRHPGPPQPTLPGSDAGLLAHGEILGGVAGRDVGGIANRVAGLPGRSGGEGGEGGEAPGVPGSGGPRTRGGTGNGGPAGHHRGTGPIDTGGERAAVCVGRACGGPAPEIAPPTDRRIEVGEPTLTETEIDREIRKRAAMFRTCYQRRLDRVPGLAGDVVIRFAIDGDGRVPTARRHAGSLADAEVVDCVVRAVLILRFPAKGGALVTYPFVFSPGG